jgi:hypothetical protein
MWHRGLVLAALLVCVWAAGASAARSADRGKDRPPGRLTEDAKSIWMTEWTACWRVPMSNMSKVLHIPLRPGMTPQQAANSLRAARSTCCIETTPETLAAADGCRNGILWRYYHPS